MAAAIMITRTPVRTPVFAGRPGVHAGGFARRPGCARPGGDVGCDVDQFRVGPCGEGLAHPQVELVLGQPSLHERGFEHVDHLLAVDVRRAEAATASGEVGHTIIDHHSAFAINMNEPTSQKKR